MEGGCKKNQKGVQGWIKGVRRGGRFGRRLKDQERALEEEEGVEKAWQEVKGCRKGVG